MSPSETVTRKPDQTTGRSNTLAIIAGMGANIWLGGSALYWKALREVSPSVLVAYRVLLSLAVLMLALVLLGKLGALYRNLTLNSVVVHGVAALLLATNWGLFIYASIQGFVLESGLGYLIAPCITVAASVLMLSERLSSLHTVAFVLIGIALAYLAVYAQGLNHGIYLAIALTWGGYVCLKKVSTIDALCATALETLLLSLVCLVALLFTSWEMALPVRMPTSMSIVLLFAGLVSVVPLLLIAFSARRLALTTMSTFQFLLPTTQFVLAVVVYKQSINMTVATVISFVWLLLALLVALPAMKNMLRQ
ncbi:hypothetical protein LOY37_14695 [Pseudomonas sp. B21-012]|uniref:EamA family transporter n=1 Tax=Pseudomonas sp. B21-012 TaxID=2895472 RepID=UPI00215EA709|nr:hypothetical protein [Pseudomonas sp. B21-012]UVM53625.1 hypothetical protein LOY37_14695 [Pseudomonas sp. B21-012]